MHPHIAVSGNDVHIIWTDERNGGIQDVYYRNSKDGGQNWNSEQRLTNYTDHEGGMCIANEGSNVHIIWSRWLLKPEVFYMNSTDGGISWSSEQQLTPDNDIGTEPHSIAVWQDNIHLVYSEQDEVYYINSTDGGVTWHQSRRISDLTNASINPDICVHNSTVYILWQDQRDNEPYVGAWNIYYAVSNNSGNDWSENIRLTYQTIGVCGEPATAIDNSVVHVVWQDNRSSDTIIDRDIYYKRYPDFPDPEFNISLQEGWNLISLPLEQSDESIDQVLSSITGKWDYIRTYDALTGTWESNSSYMPYQLNDFSALNHKQGFWINITEPGGTILTCSGYDPPSTTISLYAGWNLVGYPSLTNEIVGNALWGTGADKVMVCDTSEPYHIKDVGPTYLMKPGEGYWVHVPADSTWIVNW
jgi:hypothetical protein